jgi:uncharacterized protein
MSPSSSVNAFLGAHTPQIRTYVENQLLEQRSLLKGTTQDATGKAYCRRFMFYRLQKHLRNFLQHKAEPRWILIPGLRGVGKTTLLSQLFFDVDTMIKPDHILYVSLDDVVNKLGADLYAVLEAYEEILQTFFTDLKEDAVLLVDEVHYDPKWQNALKTLYDRSKRVFIVATGSSATEMAMSTDVARRAYVEKLYPLKFAEYVMLAGRQDGTECMPTRGLADAIKQALFLTSSLREAHELLRSKESDVRAYWQRVEKYSLLRYLKYFSLPSALLLREEAQIFRMSNGVIDRIVERDIPQIKKFDGDTIRQIPKVLFAIAGSDEISYEKIAGLMQGMTINTVVAVMDVLQKAELILRIYPYGSVYSKVRKSSKYLFLAPSMRAALLSVLDARSIDTRYRGKLLEDMVGMYLYRTLNRNNVTISYDPGAGSADFITDLPVGERAWEVGWGKNDAAQLYATMKKRGIREGILVTDAPLAIRTSGDATVLTLPLNYFVLM